MISDEALATGATKPSPAWVAELRRLRSLYSLDLLGSDDGRFDRFGRLAASVLEVPVALVTVLDDDHQWFCAAVGTDLDGNVRAESFCTRLVDDRRSLLIVPDTLADERFSSLPIVSGPPHIRFYAGATVRSPDGQPIGSLCVLDVEPREFGDDKQQILRDLADLVEREIHHLRLALLDELTEVANRRAFLSAAERYLSLAERRCEPVSLIFADIDGLKQVNDTHGHVAGDALIRRTADVLSSAIRSVDFIARIGGDEFAIVLYDCDADAAVHAVERLVRRIDTVNADPDAADPALAVSFGSATTLPGESTLLELIDRADEAMYATRSSQRRPT